MMSNNDLLISVRRTVVPLIVGLVAGSFLGPYIDPVELERVVTAVISIGYYTVIRIIERRLPAVGLLLGSKKQPTYLDGPVP